MHILGIAVGVIRQDLPDCLVNWQIFNIDHREVDRSICGLDDPLDLRDLAYVVSNDAAPRLAICQVHFAPLSKS